MSIIVNQDTRVVVRGITGNEGRFHTRAMLNYGTKIVAGITPGKGNQEIDGVPVYDTITEAVAKHRPNTSILFVPAPYARDAMIEDIHAGIKTIIVITEGIPQRDEIEFLALANKFGVTVIGPNCPGIINPSRKIKIGILPAQIFTPGSTGIVSRSGTLSYEIAWHLTKSGFGQSTCVGIGGDPIIGPDFIKILDKFKDDEETERVVLIGEIGGSAEEMAARYIAETNYPKPVVAYIAGIAAPPGKQMGHAGAIFSGGTGTAAIKIAALKKAGVQVADKPGEIVELLGVPLPA